MLCVCLVCLLLVVGPLPLAGSCWLWVSSLFLMFGVCLLLLRGDVVCCLSCSVTRSSCIVVCCVLPFLMCCLLFGVWCLSLLFCVRRVFGSVVVALVLFYVWKVFEGSFLFGAFVCYVLFVVSCYVFVVRRVLLLVVLFLGGGRMVGGCSRLRLLVVGPLLHAFGI